jgi:alanine racemase
VRATKAIVSLSAIRHNVSELKRASGDAILMAVVKANAYGHGAVEVARAALLVGGDWLGVAMMEEGVELRLAGIEAPILVMGVLSDEDCAACVAHDLSACVHLPSQVEAMQCAAEETGKTACAHLKIDSGFHRIGVSEADLDRMLEAFAANGRVRMEGIFTHFATADMDDDSFVFEQLAHFDAVLENVRQHGFDPIVHVSNSAALVRHGKLCGQMVRMGIAMYGGVAAEHMPKSIELRPALRFVSEIGAIGFVKPGETIGYGRVFRAARHSIIATIPVGYADGYARILGNRAQVLIHGKRCPVVGRVCMDQMMVDVTDVDCARRGDEVVLIGSQGTERILACELAGHMQSIDYEVFTGISCRVPREYER